MIRAFDRISDLEDVRVAVLTGKGKCFCAGADIKARAGAPRGPGDAWRGVRHALECFHAIMECRKPVVAAINGLHWVPGSRLRLMRHPGGGRERVARLARDRRRPNGRGRHAMRLFGHSRAHRMMLTGYRVPGPKLYHLGVVEACVPDGELMNMAMDLARQIAAKSPIANVTAKHTLNTIEEMTLRDSYRFEQNMTMNPRSTEDSKEAMQAFIDKRKPVFRGR